MIFPTNLYLYPARGQNVPMNKGYFLPIYLSMRAQLLHGITRATGLSQKIVLRLIDTVSVSYSGPQGGTTYHLGLRLKGQFDNRELTDSQLEVFAHYVQQFKLRCPKVYRWLTHGGFDPSKVPEDLLKRDLIHSTRVFGQLRAKAIRELRL